MIGRGVDPNPHSIPNRQVVGTIVARNGGARKEAEAAGVKVVTAEGGSEAAKNAV